MSGKFEHPPGAGQGGTPPEQDSASVAAGTAPAARVAAASAAPGAGTAASGAGAGISPAAAAIMRADRIKPKNHRTTWLMVGLGILATLFITAGVAAPQAMYWYDEGRYDSLVDELYDLQTRAADLEVEATALETLVYKQDQEVAGVLPRLERQSGASAEVIVAERATAIREAAAGLKEALRQARSESGAGSEADTEAPADEAAPAEPASLAALDRRIDQGSAVAPLSWFDIETSEMSILIGTPPEKVEKSEVSETVTREMIDQMRADTLAATTQITELEAKVSGLERRSGVLRDAYEVAYDALAESAKATVQRAAAIAEATVDAEPERVAMTKAAAAASGVVTATSLVQLENGALVVDSELKTMPEGAVEVATGQRFSRFALLLDRHRAYIGAATAAIAAQQLIDEERAAEEARIAEEEQAYQDWLAQLEGEQGNDDSSAGGADGGAINPGDDAGAQDGSEADGEATDADAGAGDAGDGGGADGSTDAADGGDGVDAAGVDAAGFIEMSDGSAELAA